MKILPKEYEQYCNKTLKTTTCSQMNNYKYKKQKI